MLLFIRVFLVLYGLIAVVTGFHAATGTYDPSVAPMADNSHRFIAAIWGAMSLAFFYVAWFPYEVTLFRFLMIALFVGGVVRLIALVNYPPTPALIMLILMELVPTALMWWMHSKLLDNGTF